MTMTLRKAVFSEAPIIWEILQQAIAQRKEDGSKQWQNGYPNEQIVRDDIASGSAHLLTDNKKVVAYAAIIFGIEPAYNDIKGKWLSNGDYVVVHRLATARAEKGKGIATKLFQLLEELCIEQEVYSIKVDTNFDNSAMLKLLDRLNYTYCGEVIIGGAARRAYEKVIQKK